MAAAGVPQPSPDHESKCSGERDPDAAELDRPTLAQRATEALGVLAVFGAGWVLVLGFDLHAFAPFVVAAAVAFGLLATAEGRH